MAYIIFSSGSTGKPKGIKIAHRGLLYPAEAIGKLFEIKEQDRVGWYSLLSFDASLVDIMTALANGAVCVIVPNNIRLNFSALTSYMIKHQISIITFVPSVLRNLEAKNFKSLRGLISTGESGDKHLFDEWLGNGHSSTSPRKIINGYGPTEVSAVTSLALYKPTEEIHLGDKPIDSLRWYVCDDTEGSFPKNLKKLSPGGKGVLCLVGKGVGLGYLDENSPGWRFSKYKGEDAYCTGDLIECGDGRVYFKGRSDAQEKLNGVLFHPAALEELLFGFKNDGSKRNSAVIAQVVSRKSAEKNFKSAFQVLNAFIKGNNVDETFIRELYFYLKYNDEVVENVKTLPSRFTVLSNWPTLEGSGKTDRNALKELASTSMENQFFPVHSFDFKVSDDNTVGKYLMNLWSDILGVPEDKLNLDSNFIDLGGDSLSVSYLLGNIKRNYNIDIDRKKFLVCPTIRILLEQVNPLSKVDFVEKKFPEDLQKFKELLTKKVPIVFVHSAMGSSCEEFEAIKSIWDDEKNIFGKDLPMLFLHSPSLGNSGYIAESIESLASHYIKSLLLHESFENYSGPIFFVGYSAGGMLAYEMVRQLQKTRQVACCCIDTLSPSVYRDMNRESYANEIFSMMRHLLKLRFSVGIQVTLDELQKCNSDKQLRAVWQKQMDQWSGVVGDRERLLGYQAMLTSLVQTQFDYHPEKYHGSVKATLLTTNENRSKSDANLGWGKLPSCVISLDSSVPHQHLDIVKLDKKDWIEKQVVPKIEEAYRTAFHPQKPWALLSMSFGFLGMAARNIAFRNGSDPIVYPLSALAALSLIAIPIMIKAKKITPGLVGMLFEHFTKGRSELKRLLFWPGVASSTQPAQESEEKAIDPLSNQLKM